MSTCFFIGHRDAPDSILPSLSAAIETRIVEDGVDQFVVGNYGRFDLLAAQAVRKAKKQHPDILLFYLRPYHPAERSFTPAGFDGSFSARDGDSPAEAGNRPGQPIHGGQQSVPHRLRPIHGQQCVGADRVRLEKREKGPDSCRKSGASMNFPPHFASDTIDVNSS